MQCNICNSENTKVKFKTFNSHGKDIINKDTKYDLYECQDCTSLFLDINLDDKYYNEEYGEDYYIEQKFNPIINLFLNFCSKLKETLLLKIISKPKIEILDVGCGSGKFLSGLSNKFSKNGLEINSLGAKLSKENGINVYNNKVEDTKFDKKFDIITMWSVLEHIEDPVGTLIKIREILNEDGRLVFMVPNSKSLGFKIGKQYYYHMDSPRHLWIPNKNSIKKLCELSGFEIAEIKNEFYEYPFDLFSSVRTSFLKFLIYPFYPIFKFFGKELLTFVCKRS